MSIDRKEANGSTIRFGIRWDDGRRPKRSLLALFAGVLLAVAGGSAAHAKPAAALVDVVVVADASRTGAAARLTERLGGTVRERLAIVDGFTASVPQAAVARLRSAGSVRSVSRDSTLRLSSNPGAGAPVAAASSEVIRGATGITGLDPSLDGTGVDVAVLDSGAVELGGLEQPGKLVRGPDFSAESHDPQLAGMDTFGHGTHVAGVIAGSDPAGGFGGVAPGARIVSVKVAGADGTTSLGQVLLAFDWILRHHDADGLDVRVVNISLGVVDPGGYRRSPLAWAVEQLWQEGIVVVAAAGNQGAGAGGLDLPAADPFIVAVGATDTHGTADPADDTVADYSSRSAVRPPDVVAPGSGVVSVRVPNSTLDLEFPGARIGSRFFRGSGTSQAAAVVSGLAARLIGQRPELSPDQVKALLRAGAVDLAEPVSGDGAGRVDVARSAALGTPSQESAAQAFEAAVLDLGAPFGRGPRDSDYRHEQDRDRDGDADDHGPGRGRAPDHALAPGNARWSGMKWSGRRWSGMKWSGRRWSGMKWSGRRWSGAEWDGGKEG